MVPVTPKSEMGITNHGSPARTMAMSWKSFLLNSAATGPGNTATITEKNTPMAKVAKSTRTRIARTRSMRPAPLLNPTSGCMACMTPSEG